LFFALLNQRTKRLGFSGGSADLDSDQHQREQTTAARALSIDFDWRRWRAPRPYRCRPRRLTQAGVEHAFRATPGAHTRAVWSRYLHEVAPQLF
jgi:hypothetical protein